MMIFIIAGIFYFRNMEMDEEEKEYYNKDK